MDPLTHDPRTKQQIKDALYQYLYAPVTRSFRERIEKLVDRNTALGGYSHKHFVYKGVLYNTDVTNPPLRKNRLIPQLKQPMDDYLTELEHLNNKELPYVLGFINQVLNASDNLTDYLRVLPEVIHAPLQEMQASCPCRATSLASEKVELLKASNHDPITMIRQRLVTNLLI